MLFISIYRLLSIERKLTLHLFLLIQFEKKLKVAGIVSTNAASLSGSDSWTIRLRLDIIVQCELIWSFIRKSNTDEGSMFISDNCCRHNIPNHPCQF